MLLSVSLLLATVYGLGFKAVFGSPKEAGLESELELISYKYSLLEKDFKRLDNRLKNIAAIENSVYRPVLGSGYPAGYIQEIRFWRIKKIRGNRRL